MATRPIEEKNAATILAAHASARVGSLEKLLGVSELESLLGIERSTIFRWYKAGKFPQPRHLMSRRVWPVSEVEAWVREQFARPAPLRSNLNKASSDASAAA